MPSVKKLIKLVAQLDIQMLDNSRLYPPFRRNKRIGTQTLNDRYSRKDGLGGTTAFHKTLHQIFVRMCSFSL